MLPYHHEQHRLIQPPHTDMYDKLVLGKGVAGCERHCVPKKNSPLKKYEDEGHKKSAGHRGGTALAEWVAPGRDCLAIANW